MCRWKIREDVRKSGHLSVKWLWLRGSEVMEKASKVKRRDSGRLQKLCVSPTQTQHGVWEWPRLNAWHKGISCNWTSGPENLSVRLSGKSLTWKDSPLFCPVFVNHIKLLLQLAPWFQSWCVSRIIHLSQGPVVRSVTCWSVGLRPEPPGSERSRSIISGTGGANWPAVEEKAGQPRDGNFLGDFGPHRYLLYWLLYNDKTFMKSALMEITLKYLSFLHISEHLSLTKWFKSVTFLHLKHFRPIC